IVHWAIPSTVWSRLQLPTREYSSIAMSPVTTQEHPKGDMRLAPDGKPTVCQYVRWCVCAPLMITEAGPESRQYGMASLRLHGTVLDSKLEVRPMATAEKPVKLTVNLGDRDLYRAI